MEFTFTAPLQRWDGAAAWYFVVLPEGVADEIEDSPINRRGFGSLRVEVEVGDTHWSTSIFPDKGHGSFLLFVKKQVRTREGLLEGDPVSVTLTVVS